MALMNKDTSARDEYFAKVRMLKHQKEEINTLRSEISSMKNDMSEIKNLLAQLIGKGANG